MAVVARRFDVHLVMLDPTVGSEIQKTRPCVVVSPDDMNRHIATVIVAPMSIRGKNYPSRVDCTFNGRAGQIVLDQIRSVDKSRLIKRLGTLDTSAQKMALTVLAQIFAN